MAAPGAPKKHSRSQVQIPGHNHASADDQQIYLISDLDTASDITPDDQVFQEETFEILAALDIDPQWITVDETMKIQSGNPHFFVTPVFSGKVFDHLESCKCKVLGTSLIRKCLQDGRPIPKKSHPIFSSTLRKTKICFTGISRERRGHLSKLVRYMDGVAEGNLYPTVTHLVTEKGSYSSNKYRAAKTTRIPIMKPVWIEDAWKEAKKLSDRDFTGVDIVEKYLLPVFNSMVICTSGVSGQERQDLVRLIEMNGGKSPGEMKKGLCTHLVTDKTTGDKYLKAKQWANVIIVTVRWVRKCVELGYVQDEKKYDPAKPTEPVAKNSTQKPGAEPPRDLDTSSIYGPLKQTVISFEEHNTTGKTVHSPVTPFTMPRTQSRRLLPSEDEVNEIIRSLDKVFDTTLNGDFDFFESCCIFVAGVDKARQEKINRVLDRCGATRVNSIERATHIVVTVVKDSEKRVLIEAQSRGVAVLRSDWLFGCIDGKQFLPTDEYLWDQDPARPGISSSSVVAASRLSIDSVRTRVSGFVETPRAGTHIQAAHQMDIDFTEPLEFHACATSTPKIPHGQPRGSKSTERFNPRFHIEGVSQLVAEMPSPVITEEEDSMACITVTQMGKRLAEAAMKTGQAPRVEPFRAISDQTITVRSTRITEKELYKTTPRREKKGTVVAAKPDPSEEAARSDQLMQKQMNFLAQTARSTSEEPMQPMSSTKRKRPHEMIADSPASDTVKRVSALEPAVDWHTTITHVHQYEELVVGRTGGAIHTSVQEVRDESLNISMDVPVNAADLATKSIVITDHFSKQGDVAPVSTRQSSERRTKENVTPLKHRPTSVKPTRTPPMRAAKQIQRPHVFMFTGLTAEEKQMCEEAIVKLGGRLATEQNDIPNELTHLICGKLVRGSKLMGCIASGRWIITTAYLRDSMTVGKFLPEERFEWGNPVNMAKYKLQGREVQLAKASLRWRLTLRENNKLIRNVCHTRETTPSIWFEMTPLTNHYYLKREFFCGGLYLFVCMFETTKQNRPKCALEHDFCPNEAIGSFLLLQTAQPPMRTEGKKTKGVFSGWRVILYASREKEKGLVPLLKAGDADVTTREKMTCSIAEYEPTHVIPVKSDSWTQEELKQVVEAGAKVFPLEYISNLLIEEFVREEDCYHRDYQVFLDCMP